MEKKIQQSKFSNKRFYSYSVVISLFGAISAIILFLGHILEITVTNDLISKFNVDFSDEIRAFNWVSESSVKNFASSYIWIISLGATIFVSMLLILSYFRNPKRDGKQKNADLSIMLIYFVLSVTISYFYDAISLSRPINWIMWTAFSAVCGFSSHLLSRARFRFRLILIKEKLSFFSPTVGVSFFIKSLKVKVPLML